MTASLLDKSLVYVTGKGGVGKTTVAAAIGLASAARGRRTIVCEVAHQDRVSRAFARHGVREETEIELERGLWAITIDPEAALREWLSGQLGSRMVRLLAHSHAFQYFVAAAPGAKELVTIGKVWELAQATRWDRHNPRTYDTVVVDAPASGHGLAMLTTPRTFGEIARVGPIRRQAFKIRDMLADPARTGYVAVALPEEMPVNETLELEEHLEAAVGTGLDAIVVNAVFPERFSKADAERLRAAADNGHRPEAAPALRAALTEYERARSQRTHLRRLRREASTSVVTLPFLFEPHVGLEEWRRLGRELERKL
jgi:anion-transporting  ArsA/GET3 family ATPase